MEKQNKENKIRKKWLFILILVVCGISITSFFQIYLIRNLLEKEIGKITPKGESRPTIETEKISPEIFVRLKKSGVERFFLSEVRFTNYYVPTVYQCLFSKDGLPIQPNYIYATWSALYYPENLPYEIALVRFLLLKEDNQKFQPNKSCYLKEIKTDKDWQELSEKYNFSRDRF